MGDILGYARVSTHDQHPDAQRDRLMEAGALRVFTDIISGKRFDRPALDCPPLEPQNSSALAGQRLTESQKRCGDVETEGLRVLRVILRTNLAMPPMTTGSRLAGVADGLSPRR